jgi:hypothetical protein
VSTVPASTSPPRLSPLKSFALILYACPPDAIEIDRALWRVLWGIFLVLPHAPIPGLTVHHILVPVWVLALVTFVQGPAILWALCVIQSIKMRRQIMVVAFIFCGIFTPAVFFYAKEFLISGWCAVRLGTRLRATKLRESEAKK